MRSNAGMANRQADVELLFAQDSAPVRSSAWLGSYHTSHFSLWKWTW